MEERSVPSHLVEAGDLIARLSKHFNQPELSDFVVTCGPHSWKVHRLILCAQSPVLSKAVQGSFKEAANRQIDLSDDPAICVNGLLRYLYELKYPVQDDALQPKLSPLSYAIQLCIIADKYDVPRLQKLAADRFKVDAESALESDEFRAAAAAAFDGETMQATQLIGEVIVDLIIKHDLLSAATGTAKAFKQTVRSTPELALAIAESALQDRKKAETWREERKAEEWVLHTCPMRECGKSFIGQTSPAGTDISCFWCGECEPIELWEPTVVGEWGW